MNSNSGFPMPYTNQPNMSMDFPAGDWRNNSYAQSGHNGNACKSAPNESCRQHDAWVYNNRQCENERVMNQLGGGFAGALAGGVAAAQTCGKIPHPAAVTICTGTVIGVAAGFGAKAGLVRANGGEACMLVVNGAGDCVDASHNHRH